MSARQAILKIFYPILMKLQSLRTGKSEHLIRSKPVEPLTSFHSLKANLLDGNEFNFQAVEGKKVLIANVASNCGYTAQYAELEKLQMKYEDELVVMGFPSNDFKGQEPGSADDIAAFCEQQYHITFPLFEKHSVLKPNQNQVYQWLTDPTKNGWNFKEPSWNFNKYLVSEKGELVGVFSQAISPLGKKIIALIEGGP